MADVLIYADTMRSPELRHEVALGIPDPFLYLEHDGAKHVVIGSMEIPRLKEIGGLTCHAYEELGSDELIASGCDYKQLHEEIAVRAVQQLGVGSAVVPAGFPIFLADRLRREGVELTADSELFDERRRVKTQDELRGIRRAQHAAEAGMSAARDLLRRAEPDGAGQDGGMLRVDGDPLTVEQIKSAIAHAFLQEGANADEFIVSHGAQAAIGHHMGAGPIHAGETVVIDLWPRDNETACFADMTRTFVVGEIPEEIREWHRLCKEALDASIERIADGADGRAIFDVSCAIFEAAGHPTQRTKEPGKPLDEGFYHGLGHGVGLEVHEAPGMGLASKKPLVAGDVVTVEPGLYRQGFGGVRLEDLVLVTKDGAENLTQFPYELAP
jgi:Xaa-Pro aminopeptidase